MKITPNQITWVRIILIPVIIFFYLSSSFIFCGKLISAGIFAVACLTDFLDGYLARKYNMVSNLGKFLDSIADKLLVVCALLLIVADGTILSPYGVIASSIIVAREFIVSALRQIGATKNVVIQADMWGKVKANFQFFAVLLFMIYSFFLDNSSILSYAVDLVFFIVCYSLLAISVIATIISGIHYLVAFKDVFYEEKSNINKSKQNEVETKETLQKIDGKDNTTSVKTSKQEDKKENGSKAKEGIDKKKN